MTPRKRAQVSRGIQYAVLAVVVLAAVLLADWQTLRQQFFQVDIITGMLPAVITTAKRMPARSSRSAAASRSRSEATRQSTRWG